MAPGVPANVQGESQRWDQVQYADGTDDGTEYLESLMRGVHNEG